MSFFTTFLVSLTNGVRHTFTWNIRSTRSEFIIHTLLCGFLQSYNSLYITYLRTDAPPEKRKRLLHVTMVARAFIIFSMVSCFIRRFHDRNHSSSIPFVFFVLTLFEDFFHYIKIGMHNIAEIFTGKKISSSAKDAEQDTQKEQRSSTVLGFAPPHERASFLESSVAD